MSFCVNYASEQSYTFRKRITALRYWLQGRKYYVALQVLELGLEIHTNKRKDGVTPEYLHQVTIASFIRTLPLPDSIMEDTIICALMHDAIEDYPDTANVIQGIIQPTNYNRLIILNKNNYVDETAYYERIGTDIICAIVKGVDRIHNIQTMVGVFTEEKQKDYINKTKVYVLPMLKYARRQFPEMESSYENIKFVLLSQIELLEYNLQQI